MTAWIAIGIGLAALLLARSGSASIGPLPDQLRELTKTSTGLSNVPPRDLLPQLDRLARVVDTMRRDLGPVEVLSGYRSPAVNAAVGGVSSSLHLQARGLDFRLSTPEATRGLFARWSADPASVRGVLQEAILYESTRPRIHIGLPEPGARPSTYFGRKEITA